MDIKNLRVNYKKSAIEFNTLEDNPIQYFMNWLADALVVNKDEANACVLSTMSALNRPSSRVVLLKGVNENGFTFFTNYTSSKARILSITIMFFLKVWFYLLIIMMRKVLV